MPIEHLQPKGLFDSRPLGFTQVVASPPGRIVAISGQVAWDEDRRLVGEGDLGAQAEQAVRNLERALVGAGAGLEHLVQVRIYVAGYTPAAYASLAPALAKLGGGGPPPAQTLLGVQSLATPELLIEIEAMAVVPA